MGTGKGGTYVHRPYITKKRAVDWPSLNIFFLGPFVKACSIHGTRI